MQLCSLVYAPARFSLCWILLLASTVAAQVSGPAALPPQAADPATTKPLVETLRANSRLVVVDVVVQDAEGAPVHHLKQSDFAVLERNQPQEISSFEEHSTPPSATIKPLPRLDPGVFTNFPTVPTGGPINVLLLDSLNTPMKDQAYVREQMLKYLKTPRPGTRIAIFGLNQQLHMLQSLTTDPEVLRAALEARSNLPKGSPLFNDAVSGDQVGADTPESQMEDMLSSDPSMATALANLQQFEAQQQSFQTMLRSRYTLDALNSLARYLGSLPGRKNLIWFSGSFPVNILPDASLTDPFAPIDSVDDEYHQTVTLLAHAQVTVYPIDARGLMSNPVMQASNSGAAYARPGAKGQPPAIVRDMQKFSDQTASEHSTMREMAAETGGKAFVNTNGLKEAVDEALRTGSDYYTLTYTPIDRNWKGEYRKIQVKLEEKGYVLSYRRGYYAEDPNPTPKKTKSATAATPSPASTAEPHFEPMHVAMEWGSATPTQIVMGIRVQPTTGINVPAALPGTQIAAKASGPFCNFTILYKADPHDFNVSSAPDGKSHIEIEFLAFVYDDQGVLVASTGNRVIGNLTPEQFAGFQRGGAQYRQEISVPAGRTNLFFRVGIRDLTTDKVGAIELPLSSVARLKPLSAPAPAPASPKP
jgi:VWFA-related protein